MADMNRILKIADGLDVEPLRDALQAQPELWNQNTARTAHPDSPHHELSDIWARFAGPGVNGGEPHESIWYPCADLLPIRDLVYPLMSGVHGDQLGGVLITKIPAGKACKPHSDPGWHARFYEKFAVQIDADPRQEFCCEGESLVTKPGDLFWFDNSFTHWVTNPTEFDRITAIVCIRSDLFKGARA
jgi:hypothetical protein